MEYTNRNGYMIPNLTMHGQPKQPIGKYGSLRREFLRENDPVTYNEMMLAGTLYPHLAEIDRMIREQVDDTMKQLLKAQPAPNRKTDPLGWAQHMTTLKLQAEEVPMQAIYTM